MDIIQIITLAIVQGLTEFLPISSSAHLILAPRLLGWEDQGLAFDVAVHIGTLTAVIYYFKKDLQIIFRDFFASIKQKKQVGHSLIAWAVGFGTIPVGIAGLLFNDLIGVSLRSPLVIASTTIIFGLLLWKADTFKPKFDESNITIKVGLLIGLAQVLALIPGTSRSGITITAALMMGFSKSAAARFSFLLSIPVIVLAGSLKIIELVKSSVAVDWSALGLGVVLSAISAYICIKLFLEIIEKMGMLPFVIYRLILGIFLVVLFF